ncbi:MAG TPA: DUF5675 family protein [Candidatus Binatia bacterium]|nr:DUF5675 family protein [Candidatus Binatia bacterium]
MKLVRVSLATNATYGVLLQGEIPFAVTLERPWLANRKGESCIPAGDYYCKRVNSPKFGNTFEVAGVPDRTAILFHKGNLEDDTHGCILVGESFNPVLGKPGITESGHGFSEFLAITAMTNSFMLQIVETL